MMFDGDEDEDSEDEDAVQHHSHIPGPLVSRDGCTVGRFNAWVVRDMNRASADALREEEKALLKRDKQTTATYLDRRHRRTQELRMQHGRASEAVRGVREQCASRGVAGRSQHEGHKAELREKHQQYLEAQRKGAVKRFGEEQKKKTLNSQREAFEKRAAAALKAKAEEKARVDRARYELQREAEAKKGARQRGAPEARPCTLLLSPCDT